MDLEKISPAPWICGVNMHPMSENFCKAAVAVLGRDESIVVATEAGESDIEFIVLARNAFAGDPEALAWWEANRRKG